MARKYLFVVGRARVQQKITKMQLFTNINGKNNNTNTKRWLSRNEYV